MAKVHINVRTFEGTMASSYERNDGLLHAFCWYTRMASDGPWRDDAPHRTIWDHRGLVRKYSIMCPAKHVDSVLYVGTDKRCWIVRTINGLLGLLFAPSGASSPAVHGSPRSRGRTRSGADRPTLRNWVYIEGPDEEVVHSIPDEFFEEAMRTLKTLGPRRAAGVSRETP